MLGSCVDGLLMHAQKALALQFAVVAEHYAQNEILLGRIAVERL